MSSSVQLKVVQGGSVGNIITCEEGETLFGRSKDCERGAFPEDDMTASRLHFKLEVSGTRVVLCDMRSTYGTIVNGAKYGGRGGSAFGKICLRHGDRIQAGAQVFELIINDDDTPKAGTLGGLRLSLSDGPPSVDGYMVLEKQKHMGPGAFFLCRRDRDGKAVIIRVLRLGGALDENVLDKLREIVEPLCALRHENVVRMHDYGVASSDDYGAVFCFEMEHCTLGSIEHVAEAKSGRLPAHEVYDLMLDTLAGLSLVHAKNMTHGGIGPQNILVTELDGKKRAKLSGFVDHAIGRTLGFTSGGARDGRAEDSEEAASFANRLKGVGAQIFASNREVIMRFRPPEQVESLDCIQPSSDVWSLGAVFYHLLTGDYPRECSVDDRQIKSALTSEAVPIRSRERFKKRVPQGMIELLDLIDRSLALSQSRRFRDASEMHEVLKRIRRPPVVMVR